ncbi:MAG: ATP-binding cassette domain-containing protein [Intrasporangium sp.]|uniref:ABC transporter ATP-binding protein n=1 Tax=Intrasporangium sp. TaxID=1925024 RepID=UPI00264A49E6|nr:oligopeptide/dipeptide ABC transporter ATP-binding protein [Intrasporangium sp.]MDN5796377.1 ATP-binding cassette domain-containing protein [Intrasporangium sp.]
MTTPLLLLDDVHQTYRPKGSIFSRGPAGLVQAVSGVTLDINAGETLGVVGESGCGKSTLARMIVGIEDPKQGAVRWKGTDVSTLKGTERKAFHRSIQLIFQDPFASLDPRRTVGQSIAEGVLAHDLVAADAVGDRVQQLLRQVGLLPVHAWRYPHEFSGGQLQRVGIAQALGVEPEVLVCDEPVSALDVSVRAQVLNLLNQLKTELGLAIVFIAHDLDVVQHMSDRIVTMYLGKIVEQGPCDAVYESAGHPYTRALLSAIPKKPAPGYRIDRVVLEGDPPSPINPPAGCPFHTRCYAAIEMCSTVVPKAADLGDGHRATCHLAEEVSRSRVGQPYSVV